MTPTYTVGGGASQQLSDVKKMWPMLLKMWQTKHGMTSPHIEL